MDKWFYRISLALALIGLIDSTYLTILKLTENPSMCVGSHACLTVSNSSYATINGIPVAVIGAGGYLTLTALLLLENRIKFLVQSGTLVFFGLSLIAFLFTLYLIFVEVALIRALCPFCVASQVTMTLLFILSIIRLVRQPIN